MFRLKEDTDLSQNSYPCPLLGHCAPFPAQSFVSGLVVRIVLLLPLTPSCWGICPGHGRCLSTPIPCLLWSRDLKPGFHSRVPVNSRVFGGRSLSSSHAAALPLCVTNETFTRMEAATLLHSGWGPCLGWGVGLTGLCSNKATSPECAGGQCTKSVRPLAASTQHQRALLGILM